MFEGIVHQFYKLFNIFVYVGLIEIYFYIIFTRSVASCNAASEGVRTRVALVSVLHQLRESWLVRAGALSLQEPSAASCSGMC